MTGKPSTPIAIEAQTPATDTTRPTRRPDSGDAPLAAGAGSGDVAVGSGDFGSGDGDPGAPEE